MRIRERHLRLISQKSHLREQNKFEVERIIADSQSILASNLKLREVSSLRYRQRLTNYSQKRFRVRPKFSPSR